MQFVQFAGRHEHLLAGATVADGHRFSGEPFGRAGTVHGGESAADHDRWAGQRGKAMLVDVEEEIEPMPNTGHVLARQIEEVPPQGAGRQDHGIVPGQQLDEVHIFADLDATADFHAAAANLFDLAVDDVARQAEGGNALIHHTARPDVFFQHDDRVAATCQFPRHGHAGHARSDDCNSLARRLVEKRGQRDGLAGSEVGSRPLAEANGQRIAPLAAMAAGRFARPGTDPPQHG